MYEQVLNQENQLVKTPKGCFMMTEFRYYFLSLTLYGHATIL